MLVWSLDDVAIPDVCSFDAREQQVIGTATYNGRLFKWRASANQHGWLVRVTDTRHLTSVYNGTTFNLFLEVVAAVRRFT